MSGATTERRWVPVQDFARYLGVSRSAAYRLVATDPEVKRYVKRLGGRVLVCLYAWQEGEERKMAEGRS